MTKEELVKRMNKYIGANIKKDELEQGIREAKRIFEKENQELSLLVLQNKELQDKINDNEMNKFVKFFVGKTSKLLPLNMLLLLLILVFSYCLIDIVAVPLIVFSAIGEIFLIDAISTARDYEITMKNTIDEIKSNKKKMNSKIESLVVIKDFIDRQQFKLRQTNDKAERIYFNSYIDYIDDNKENTKKKR